MSDQDFSGHLFDGELLLWSGRPPIELRVTWRDLILAPFSIVFAAVVFRMFQPFWAAPSESPLFTIFSVWFVVGAAFLVFGRFLVDMWLRLRTRYAVTDRRVLIFRGGPPKAQAYLPITDLPELTLVQRGDRGTIWFAPQPGLFGFNRGFLSARLAVEWSALLPSLAPDHLFAIDEPRRVFELLQSRRAKAVA